MLNSMALRAETRKRRGGGEEKHVEGKDLEKIMSVMRRPHPRGVGERDVCSIVWTRRIKPPGEYKCLHKKNLIQMMLTHYGNSLLIYFFSTTTRYLSLGEQVCSNSHKNAKTIGFSRKT